MPRLGEALSVPCWRRWLIESGKPHPRKSAILQKYANHIRGRRRRAQARRDASRRESAHGPTMHGHPGPRRERPRREHDRRLHANARVCLELRTSLRNRLFVLKRLPLVLRYANVCSDAVVHWRVPRSSRLMPTHSWASVLASQAAVATGDALLLLFSILFCLKIYDIFLKRRTPACASNTAWMKASIELAGLSRNVCGGTRWWRSRCFAHIISV